jgi:RNA binding exosome subunit
MVFLNVKFRAFCHATEDPSKVKAALDFLLPTGSISESKTAGHYGNPIVVLESRTSKKSEIRSFWERVGESVPKHELLDDISSRIDLQCVLHARLDKQKAYLGKIEIVEHEDVIVVSSKIESYPRKRETAISNAKDFFGRSG